MRWRRRNSRKPPETAEQLLRRCERWHRGALAVGISLVSVYAIALIVLASAGHLYANPPRMLAAGVGASLLAVLSATLYTSIRGRALARLVSELDDPRALTPLIDSLLVAARAAHPEVEVALARHLARITPQQAADLNGQRRALLRRALAGRRSPILDLDADGAYLRAILHALVVIGDTKAIPNVEALLRKTDDPEVRAEAEVALATLRDLQEKAVARDTLLRPASPDAECGLLVRPAGPGASDAELLVRPSEPHTETGAVTAFVGDADAVELAEEEQRTG